MNTEQDGEMPVNSLGAIKQIYSFILRHYSMQLRPLLGKSS